MLPSSKEASCFSSQYLASELFPEKVLKFLGDSAKVNRKEF